MSTVKRRWRRGPALDDFIRVNMPLARAPRVPEICLHRAHPSSGLWRLAERDERGFGAPYWAYPWAGGIALARYILDYPAIVAGRRVLDFGAGSGIVAIAAARAGAREVIASEIDEYAIAAIALNAAANGVSISTVARDFTSSATPPVDLVVAGDVFYERELAERVTGFLGRCIASGVNVLVGDPGRAFLPHDRLRLLAEYPTHDFGGYDDRAATASGVFRYGRSAGYT